MKIYLGPTGTLSFLLLAACILLNVAIGFLFLLRKNENKRADFFFAAWQFAFGLTAFYEILVLQDIYREQPQWLFLPVYYTLSLGVLLFFSIKLRLFPTYKFVATDSKHFILPVGQFLYFLLLFVFADVAFRQSVGRKFYSPFYGGLEMGLYIATFYGYLFGAYRYIRYKVASMRHSGAGWPLHEVLQLRRLVRVMLVLFWVNSVYIIADFVMYELLRLNMHDFRGFTRFGEFSFAAMAGWAGWMGVVLLLKHPYKSFSGLLLFQLKKRLKKSR
ncbi:MAG: hypothetical protein ACE5FF_02640 [Saprospiraceae bacterium]